MPVAALPYWMKTPAGRTFRRLEKIRDIVDDEGECTVRRVLYRLYPTLHGAALDKKYNTTIKDVVRARILGMVPWSSIRESRVEFRGGKGWTSIDSYINWKTDLGMLATLYSRDKTPSHLRPIVVLFEKNTVVREFGRVCGKYDVPWMSTRGQLTWTEKNKSATERLKNDSLVLYFGDNDEKGREIMDVIERDIAYRGCRADIEWVAVTEDQEERFGLPSEARLDGLRLSDLQKLVEEIVSEYIDDYIYKDILDEEKEDKRRIRNGTLSLELEEEDA